MRMFFFFCNAVEKKKVGIVIMQVVRGARSLIQLLELANYAVALLISAIPVGLQAVCTTTMAVGGLSDLVLFVCFSTFLLVQLLVWLVTESSSANFLFFWILLR
jgi:hypothetical protein